MPNTTSEEQIKRYLTGCEDENIEFKRAQNSFSKDKDLPDYCAALANEGGGKLILGVDDNKNVVGTKAFTGSHKEIANRLLSGMSIRVDTEENFYENKRILIFHIPPRPRGGLIKSYGKYKYPMRTGSSLTEMTQGKIKEILTETENDFSSQIVPGLTASDIDRRSVDIFQQRRRQRQENKSVDKYDIIKVLHDIGAVTEKGVTYASLILFGKEEKIREHLPCSEICFEWRQENNKIRHDYRQDWRAPFFLIMDEVWQAINARNIRFPYQEGLVQRDIKAFNETTIREALLNAVTHRDYRIQSSSIFIKVSPQIFSITSPGGFPTGVTPQNILHQHAWRNRLIAEIFQFAGLIERSGQGMDTIYLNTIKEGKGLPNFEGSDDYQVCLSIPCQVEDFRFVALLAKIIDETKECLSVEEMMELELVRKGKKITNLAFKDRFLEMGIIEKIGKTKGTIYILAQDWHQRIGQEEIQTRIVGIRRKKNKDLIIEHLKKNQSGATNKDFQEILGFKQNTVANMLRELQREGKVCFVGSRKNGKWFLQVG